VYNLDGGAPVQRLVRAVGLKNLALQRMLPVLGLAVAVLAGLGLEELIVRWRQRSTSIALIISTAVIGAVIIELWVRSEALGPIPQGTARPIHGVAVRQSALRWPSVEVGVLLLAALILPLLARHSRLSGSKTHGVPLAAILGCTGLVGVQGAFLVVAGTGINSYAPTSYPVTPTVTTLQRLVGDHLVGFDVGSDTCADADAGQACGVRSWAGIGFYPDINLGYGIAELAVHDPLIPKAYFNSWPIPNAGQEGAGANVFAPSIDDVALAQRYGVQYVLIQPPQPVPAGMQLVNTIEDPAGVPVKLAYVPNSGQFSFAPTWESPPAAVLSVSHPSDVTYRLRVRTAVTARLIIRITDVAVARSV
jgi:hypothetical protein